MSHASLPWKHAGVMGLGLSGVAAAGLLARRGVRVTAFDQQPLEALGPQAAALQGLGVTLRCGVADAPGIFRGCDVVVASPGVPPSSPPLAEARAGCVPIIAEVELGSRLARGALVGVTGSNGKSTVTTLAGEILRAAGMSVRVCGNVGTPLTAVAEQDLALPEEEARRIHYVVELSSFQLEGIETLRAQVAVLLNLSPDHQDRYVRPEDYYAAKSRIFENQVGDDVAVVNWDDGPCREMAARLTARLFPFSLTHDLEEGAVLDGGRLVLRRAGRDEVLTEAAEVPLPGRHNLENVLAAASAAAHCGAPPAAVASAVAGFKGLPHRLEPVGEVGGVAYYNDSKATNVGATRRALESFDRPIVLLLGGYDKGGDFESLREPMRGKLRALVTFGKAGADIARRLEGAAPLVLRAGALADAVRQAAGAATSGDVVLLAPACASFDAYSGFDRRGEDFRSQVRGLTARAQGGS